METGRTRFSREWRAFGKTAGADLSETAGYLSKRVSKQVKNILLLNKPIEYIRHHPLYAGRTARLDIDCGNALIMSGFPGFTLFALLIRPVAVCRRDLNQIV